MDRKKYIEAMNGLTGLVDQLQEQNENIEALGLPDDFTVMESDLRKTATAVIDKLHDRLFTIVAVSEKVAADNVATGKGNQVDMDFANGEDGQGDLFDGKAEVGGGLTEEDFAIAKADEEKRTKAKKAGKKKSR